MTFGEKLRAVMKAADVSPTELTRRWINAYGGDENSVRTRIARWRNRTAKQPTGDNISRLATLLGVRPAELLPEPGQDQAAETLRRLAEVEELAVENTENVDRLQDESEALRTSLASLRRGIDARLDKLESRVRALER